MLRGGRRPSDSSSYRCSCAGTIIFAVLVLCVVTVFQQNLANPPICIITRTYVNADRFLLRSFLSSVQAQSYSKYQVWLINSDDPTTRIFPDEVRQLDDPRFISKVFNIDKHKSVYNSYGYFATEVALRDLLASKNHGFKYVLITNGDNLYHRNFLTKTLAVFESGRELYPCIVAVDFVSRYQIRHENNSLSPPNNVRFSQYAENMIDLGSALIKIESIGSTFPHRHADSMFVKGNTKADFFFFSGIVRSSANKSCGANVREVLFVHQ
jgi:hypothetical protein